MLATIFHTILGLLFVTDSLVRVWNLHRRNPLPVTTETNYRQNMHLNMVIGVLLLACVMFS